VLRIERGADGRLRARLDSPDQGVAGLPVDSVTLKGRTLRFGLKRPRCRFRGELGEGGDEIVGEWTQGGQKFPLVLRRTDSADGPRRPQDPSPPYPYREEPVAYQNRAGGVTLAGTLTIPEGEGRSPAAILISGSGAQDRDEALFGHRPFLVLADDLTRRGIAVLRVDDRGVGGSTGDIATSTSEDLAGDVMAGVEFLRGRAEIEPAKIGLIGHSEGGIIAPMVAARDDAIAFIVLMGSPGLPGDEVLRRQTWRIAEAQGATPRQLHEQAAYLERLIEAVRGSRASGAAVDGPGARPGGPAGLRSWLLGRLFRRSAAVRAQIRGMGSRWFRFFLDYDPRAVLAKVRCPVLAIIGEKDLQVPARENLAEIEAVLTSAGHRRFLARELPGLNHLLQTSRTGLPSEYRRIEETIAPEALRLIGDWIVEQVGPR
jgi:pimeloyl-ACP methyl ester carboxylesterase